MARSGNGELPVTERAHPGGLDLDRMAPEALVGRILDEGARAIARVARQAGAIGRAAEAMAAALGGRGRIFYVGAGTSGRVGALDAAEWPPTFGVEPRRVRAIVAGGRAALSRAVEGAEDRVAEGAAAIRRPGVGPDDVVCGITASGGTPFVRGALEVAERRGATTILITSNEASVLPAGIRIVLDTGPELLSGSTRLKAGLATHAVLQAMSTAAAARAGRVYGQRMVGVRATNAKLRARARRIVADLAGLSDRGAGAVLRRAGGRVDVAIFLARRGGTAAAARARVRSAGGLRAALEGAGS